MFDQGEAHTGVQPLRRVVRLDVQRHASSSRVRERYESADQARAGPVTSSRLDKGNIHEPKFSFSQVNVDSSNRQTI